MTNCVDVKITAVDSGEIDNLATLMHAVQSPEEFDENIVDWGQEKNYVVTVKTGQLRELKNALRAILQVIEPGRIDIEPWNGPYSRWARQHKTDPGTRSSET